MAEIEEKQGEKKDEDIFVKSIGNFGIWQATVCVLANLVKISGAWNGYSILFLTPRTTFICKTFSENLTISEVETSKCYNDCLEYRYENDVFEETIISQFGLICERAWLASFAQSSMMFGILVGTNLFGWVADRFGRRTGILICILSNCIFQLSASYTQSYWVFTAFRLLDGISTGGIFVIATVITTEISGPKYRSIVGCLSFILASSGQVSLVIFAYYTNTWSQMTFGTGVASVFFLTYFFLLPEVPRWLVFSGKTDEAIYVLTKAAKWNRRNTENIPTCVNQMYNDLITGRSDSNRKYNCTALFKTRKYCVRSLALYVIWCSIGLCTYGLNQYISFIGNNIYITVMITGFASMAVAPVAAAINAAFGRKVSIVGSLALGGVLMIALTFATKGNWSSTALGIIGFCCFDVSFITVYVFTPELYPTPTRNMGLGLACSGAKLGAMLAPFAASLEPRWIPSLIFAILPFVAIIACYVLPETKNKPLEDTLEE